MVWVHSCSSPSSLSYRSFERGLSTSTPHARGRRQRWRPFEGAVAGTDLTAPMAAPALTMASDARAPSPRFLKEFAHVVALGTDQVDGHGRHPSSPVHRAVHPGLASHEFEDPNLVDHDAQARRVGGRREDPPAHSERDNVVVGSSTAPGSSRASARAWSKFRATRQRLRPTRRRRRHRRDGAHRP